MFDSDDYSGRFDTNDIEQNKIIAAIGYIPVLFLVPMLATSSPVSYTHLLLAGNVIVASGGRSAGISAYHKGT